MSKSQIIQKLNNEYLAKRQRADYVAELNYSKAVKHPEFAKIHKEIASKEFDLAKMSVENENPSNYKKIKKILSKLKTQQSDLLKNINMKESDFLPSYSCSICKDTGRVENDYCTCFKNRIIDELVMASGLEKGELASFDDFDEKIAKDKNHQETLNKLKTVLVSFSEKFPTSKYCTIILSGKTGVGKSFALECTTTEIMKKGFTACFITAFNMNSQFLKYHTCFDANKQSYLDVLLDPDVLVIDDLGTEPILNNVTKEYLYLIISERMLKHKATLVSTNHKPGEILFRYGERIFSRLYNKSKSLNIVIEGDDLRLKR